MHPRQVVLMVGIALVSTACSGATPPAPASASAAVTTAPASPAASPSAAPSSAPSSSGVGKDVQVVQDAQGDAVMTTGEVPGYLDMVGASVELRDGSFVFTQSLASGVPPTPELPAGVVALGWSFCIDLDPAQNLRGYPIKGAMPCELIVHTRWDGAALAGMVFDRRPLVGGGNVTTTALVPDITGSGVSETVPPQLLPGTATFQWSAFTGELGQLGTDIAHHVDWTPDGTAARPASWPAN